MGLLYCEAIKTENISNIRCHRTMKEQVKDIRYYLDLLKKKKKIAIILALVIFTTVTVVALLLPPVYQSTCTILIQEQQIPPDFVRSTVTGFAEQRIQSLNQQLLSRTKLMDIIKQFNLYPDMKERYTREEIVKKMRKDIGIDMISAEFGGRGRGKRGGSSSSQSGMMIAFTISYRGQNPAKLQKVTGTLASLYLEQNIKLREYQAQSTTKFLEAELKDIEGRIQSLGDQITKFKEQHEGMLPELLQFNMGRADQLDKDIRQTNVNIKAAEERRIYLEGQLATVKKENFLAGSNKVAGNPAMRLKVLEVTLADLRSKFSPDHPDIKKLLREKAELEKMLGGKVGSGSQGREKLAQLKMELSQKQGKYSAQHPDIVKLKKEIELLEKEPKGRKSKSPEEASNNPAYFSLLSQIEVAKTEVESLKKQRAVMEDKLKMYRKRLEETPKLEQQYLALQRDYANAHRKHQEVMNKIYEARISEGMEEHQKGEKFSIIDPANYPEKPIKPNRPVIILSGLFFSIFVGLGTVVLVDSLDHSVKSPDELAWLTGMPVLGSIKQIRIMEDAQRKKSRKHIIIAAIGVLLIIAVVIFHFVYMDLYIFMAKLSRLVAKYK